MDKFWENYITTRPVDSKGAFDAFKQMNQDPRPTIPGPRNMQLAKASPWDYTSNVNNPDLEQSEFLRPGETLEDWEPNPFLKPHAEGGRAGYNDGQLVRPTVDGSRPGYMGEDKITELAKKYQKAGSETTLPNIKSKIRKNRLTKDIIDKFIKRGVLTGGFRKKAVENPKFYKTVLSELNKVKKQRNKNVFFDYDDVIKTGKWYKNLRTRLGNLNDADTDRIVKKVLSEEFPGSYYGQSAMRDFRRDKVVKAFINYLDVNGELDGGEKRLPELKKFQGVGNKQFRNINETFQEWTKREFEIKGIDRKKLTADQIKQLKNWSPEYSNIKSIAKEKSLKFLNDLNTNNPNLSAKEVRQRFFKKFPDVTEGSFNARITHLTQLKNSGAYTVGGGTRTFKWIVSDKNRSPWLKELLGLKFKGNYSSFINRGDKLLARGLPEEANRLYAAAEKYFGSKGIFTKYEGQGEHPFSRVFGSGPIGNELKINSLVRGDLNMFKRLNFDEPVVRLLTEYNKSTTTPKRRNELKTLIEDRKKLMNYLTESPNEKGIVESVKFNYGSKKMTVSANVVDIDKVKNFNVEDYVKRGESYLEAFKTKGAGLFDESEQIIRQKLDQKGIHKFLKQSDFNIDKCLSSGGRVGFANPAGLVGPNQCIIGVINDEMKLAKKSGDMAKFSKFGKLARAGGYLVGWVDIPIELAFALPHLLAGNIQDAKAATTAGLFGYGGKKLEQIDQEKNPEAYKYFKHVQDINDWMDAFNQEQNAAAKLEEVPEDYAETYKKHGDKSGYIDFYLKQYEEGAAKQKNITENYIGYTTEGEEDLRLLDLGKEEGKKYLRETVKKEWEKGMPIKVDFTGISYNEPFNIKPYHWAPFKEDKITSLEQQIKQKGESFYGGFMKPGVKAAAERLGKPDLYDDWYDAFYGKDPREAHSSLPLEWTDQLAELEKKELYRDLADKLARPGGAELKKSLIEQGFDFEPFREYNLQTTGGWMSEGGRAGYMGGGIAGIRKPDAIPPERQGLRSIMINCKKY